MSRWRPLCLGLLGVLAMAAPASSPDSHSPPDEPTEYQVKAAFLYNFAYFTRWPAESFAKEDSPILVGVVGADPFGKSLDSALRGKLIGKHPFQIKRFADVKRLEACHVLFICASVRKDLERILETTRGRSALVISEMNGVLGKGGIINFFIEERRVRFAIHIDEARRARLKISSHLLKLAKIVKDK